MPHGNPSEPDGEEALCGSGTRRGGSGHPTYKRASHDMKRQEPKPKKEIIPGP